MAASVTSKPLRGSDIIQCPELNDQMKKMVNASGRGAESPALWQMEVNKIVQSFVDFAATKKRLPKAEVEKVDVEMTLYAPVPKGWTEEMKDQYIIELSKQYLTLSGYTSQGFTIVELNL